MEQIKKNNQHSKRKLAHAILADIKGGMIGTKWGKFYGNYFANPKIAQLTTCACQSILHKLSKNLKILEIGAGTGIVGEAVANFLKKKGISIELIISDKIKEQIEVNKNSSTKKIVFDNKKILFPNSIFDIVIARSVTHYEPTLKQEIKVLKEVKRILKGGDFLSSNLRFQPQKKKLYCFGKSIFL